MRRVPIIFVLSFGFVMPLSVNAKSKKKATQAPPEQVEAIKKAIPGLEVKGP